MKNIRSIDKRRELIEFINWYTIYLKGKNNRYSIRFEMILSETHSSSTVNIQRGINEIFITIDVIKQHTHTHTHIFIIVSFTKWSDCPSSEIRCTKKSKRKEIYSILWHINNSMWIHRKKTLQIVFVFVEIGWLIYRRVTLLITLRQWISHFMTDEIDRAEYLHVLRRRSNGNLQYLEENFHVVLFEQELID